MHTVIKGNNEANKTHETSGRQRTEKAKERQLHGNINEQGARVAGNSEGRKKYLLDTENSAQCDQVNDFT